MEVGKKGYLMSLTVLIILLFAVSVTYFSNQPDYQNERQIETQRIQSIESFSDRIESDAKEALRIASSRGIIALTGYVGENGYFSSESSLQKAYADTVKDGELRGTEPDVMENSTFEGWLNDIQNLSKTLDFNMTYSVHDVNVTQHDAWTLKSQVNYSIEITDTQSNTTYATTQTAQTLIDVEGYQDPLIATETNNIKTPTINATTTDDVEEISKETLYTKSTTAPSYLQRFVDGTSNSPKGIETLVNVPEMQDLGFYNQDTNVIAYKYFNKESTNLCQLDGRPEWLLLSQSDANRYNENCA